MLEALQKLKDDNHEMVQTRLDGLEKVIKSTPIGQLLLFLVTIMANQKFCNLPLAKGLLSRVTTTTITATKVLLGLLITFYCQCLNVFFKISGNLKIHLIYILKQKMVVVVVKCW